METRTTAEDQAGALPSPLTNRPLSATDASAVHRVMVAQELADLGRVDVEEADIVADWQRPGFEVTQQVVGVHDGARLVGYGEVGAAGRAHAAVDPAYRGRGVGTWLARWIRATARDRGEPEVGMPVPQGSPGDLLLTSLGYRVRWTSWVLELPAGRRVLDRPLPPGFTVRTARATQHAAAHAVLEDAFLEWSRRPRETSADFEAAVLRRPGFEPWNVRVALGTADQVVGVALVHLACAEPDRAPAAWVPRLAIRADHRGRGLGQVLLADAFARAVEHGAEVCTLSTDSRTGALGLYEKVGMDVVGTYVNRAVRLG